jgi:hypothetical protein
MTRFVANMQQELLTAITDDAAGIIVDPCPCGAESTHGAHGFRDGELYDEFWCQECWNKKKS